MIYPQLFHIKSYDAFNIGIGGLVILDPLNSMIDNGKFLRIAYDKNTSDSVLKNYTDLFQKVFL